MVFEDDDQVLAFVNKHSKTTPDWVTLARKSEVELCALIQGKGFKKELIEVIEKLESPDKKKAREKYSRSIEDLFERLFLPIANVFSATGGKRDYDISNPEVKTEFLKTISKVRDGKSIESYAENHWMPLYHVDPNGIIFTEYVTEPKARAWPTYKSIHDIRTYIPNGQLLEVVLFEPILLKGGDQIWRLVDDEKDYRIIQRGTTFSIINEEIKVEGHTFNTFKTPFGQVPALINSDIVDIKDGIRLSPIHKIVGLAREFARDQSIKTLYKFLQGFPIFWKYVTQCKTCVGAGRKNDRVCSSCDGHGFIAKRDITDAVTLNPPTKDQQKLDPIAGWLTPPLDIWDQYTKELVILEILMTKTYWGAHKVEGGNETATGRWIDQQPVDNKLNKLTDVTEWVIRQLTEWVADVVIDGKDPEDNISSIFLGRRYILDSPDVLQDKYTKAKAAGENSVILDRMLSEIITAKYKNDPEWLALELKKAAVEPFVHVPLEVAFKVFGRRAAQEKEFFQKWWGQNIAIIKEKNTPEEKIQEDFDTAFIAKFPEPEVITEPIIEE